MPSQQAREARSEELCRQAWSRLQNQMQRQEEERQNFHSDLYLPPEVESKIKSYLREDPWIFSRDVREKLIQEGIYDEFNAPDLSAIYRSMQDRYTEYIQFRDESKDNSRDPTTGDASSRPLQALEQLASRGVTVTTQDPRIHVHSLDQQKQQQHVLQQQQQQQWFAHQQRLALYIQQHEQYIARQREQAAAAADAIDMGENLLLLNPPRVNFRSFLETLKRKDHIERMSGGADVSCQTNASFGWPTLEELYPTQRRTTSRMMQMMRSPSQTSAAESILASDVERQEHDTVIDLSPRKRDEASTAELESKDQRLSRIEIERRVGELASAMDELRQRTTHLESEKSRLEGEVRDLKSQLRQQCLNPSHSTRDSFTAENPWGSADSDLIIEKRAERPSTSIAICPNPLGISPQISSSSGNVEPEAEKIATDDKANKKSLDERVDLLIANTEKMQKTLDGFAALYEPQKLQIFGQGEDEGEQKIDTAVAKIREDALMKKITDLEMDRSMEEVKNIRIKLQWEVEREKLQKKLQHYESILEKRTTDTASTQTAEQKETDGQKDIEEATKCSQDKLRISKQYATFFFSALEPESQKTIAAIPPIEDLRRQFISLLANHNCNSLDCYVTEFEEKIKHANKCPRRSECDWHVCKVMNSRTEHLKVCDDKSQCKLCQPYMNLGERRMRDLVTFVGLRCDSHKCPKSPGSKKSIIFLATQTAVSYGLIGGCEEIPQVADSSSDADEAAGWEIVKSEDRSENRV